MNKNDEIFKKISGEFEKAPPVPETLSKERMVEMLKDNEITPKKKIRILPKVTAALAVLMVTLICMNVYKLIPVSLSPAEPELFEKAEQQNYPILENDVQVHELKKADSNAELKKHMESLFETSAYDYVYNFFYDKGVAGEIFDNTLTQAIVTAPESAVGTAPTQAAVNEESADELKGRDFTDSAEILTGSTSTEYGETNIQVEGVDEADIIKNDGRYLYIVSSGMHTDTRLKIVDTETMTLLYDEFIEGEKDGETLGIYDIYVNGDTLVAVCTMTDDNKGQYVYYDSIVSYGYNLWRNNTVNVVFDISDRSKPREIRRVSQDGRMVSTRMNGSILYTVTYYTVYSDTLEENYMPKVNGEFVGCDCIYIYDENSTGYTVVTAFDTKEKDGEVGKASVLASGAEVYCTSDTLYVGMYEYGYSETKTNIFAFALDGTNVAYKASGAVKGSFLNQFSFDEYNGCLRVATDYYDYKTDKDVSSLYVLNKDLELVGKLEDIADDEQIKSVRFMGDTGYVVTFRNTDPLFTLDLSDPTSPKILGELKLPGYSAYLHPIGDGYVVGIGYDGDEDNAQLNTVKVSVFDVSDPINPKETDTFVIKDAETDVNSNPKAFISSKSMGFIGIPVRHYLDDPDYEFVLSYKIIKIENGKILSHDGFTHPVGENDKFGYYLFRGTYIGEKLYTINIDTVAEHSLTSGELLRTCTILGDYDETEVVTQTAPVNYNSSAATKTTGVPATVPDTQVSEGMTGETEPAVEAEIVEKSKLF